MPTVLQDWLNDIPLMQQTVLLTAIRGPDGLPKYNSIKMLLRWYRRCVVKSAMDAKVLDDPYSRNGGSFTGPSFPIDDPRWPPEWEPLMDNLVSDYLRDIDAIPHHFHMHFLHAIEILGYKHPNSKIQKWWHVVYLRLVKDLHLSPETLTELDSRLGDTREGWLAAGDPATAH